MQKCVVPKQFWKGWTVNSFLLGAASCIYVPSKSSAAEWFVSFWPQSTHKQSALGRFLLWGENLNCVLWFHFAWVTFLSNVCNWYTKSKYQPFVSCWNYSPWKIYLHKIRKYVFPARSLGLHLDCQLTIKNEAASVWVQFCVSDEKHQICITIWKPFLCRNDKRKCLLFQVSCLQSLSLLSVLVWTTFPISPFLHLKQECLPLVSSANSTQNYLDWACKKVILMLSYFVCQYLPVC